MRFPSPEIAMPFSPLIDIAITFGLLALLTLAAKRLTSLFDLVPRELTGDQRAASLDGLRGYLALCVIVHHASIHQQYWRTGEWKETGSLVFSWLGPAPVALFFMLTGFLFWSKALRGHTADALELWVGRLRRIVPMYVFAGLMTVVIAVSLRGGWVVPTERWTSDLIHVATGGILQFPQILNGMYSFPLNAGVTWTLQFEWFFYLALPVMAWRATPRATLVLFAFALALAVVESMSKNLDPGSPLLGIACLNFSLGMVAAVVRSHASGSVPGWVRGWPGLLLCVMCVATLGLGSGHQTVWSSLAMGVLFVTVACGQDFRGLLVSQPARWLGAVSYSVYLLHGIVLYLVMSRVNHIIPVESLSTLAFWGVTGAAGLLTVAISAVTFCVIERPFIQVRPSRTLVPVASGAT